MDLSSDPFATPSKRATRTNGPLSPWNGQVSASEFKTPSRRGEASMRSILSHAQTPQSQARPQRYRPRDTPNLLGGFSSSRVTASKQADDETDAASMHKELAEMRQLVKQAKAEEKAALIKLADMETAMAKRDKQNEELTSSLEEVKGTVTQLQRELSESKRETKQAREETRALDQKYEAVCHEKDSLMAKLKDAQEELRDYKAQLKQLDAMEAELKAEQKAQQALKVQLTEGQQALVAARQRAAELEAEVAQLYEERSALEARVEEVERKRKFAEKARQRRSMGFHMEEDRRIKLEQELKQQTHASARQEVAMYQEEKEMEEQQRFERKRQVAQETQEYLREHEAAKAAQQEADREDYKDDHGEAATPKAVSFTVPASVGRRKHADLRPASRKNNKNVGDTESGSAGVAVATPKRQGALAINNLSSLSFADTTLQGMSPGVPLMEDDSSVLTISATDYGSDVAGQQPPSELDFGDDMSWE